MKRVKCDIDGINKNDINKFCSVPCYAEYGNGNIPERLNRVDFLIIEGEFEVINLYLNKLIESGMIEVKPIVTEAWDGWVILYPKSANTE